VTVLHGDCLEVMRGMADASVDCVLTDPPYGLEGMAGGYGRAHKTIANDRDLSMLEAALPGLRRVVRPDSWAAFFCSARKRTPTEVLLAAAGFEPYGEVIWDKGSPSLGYHIRYAHETVIVCRVGEPPRPPSPLLSILRAPRPRGEHGHPHEKPVSVLRALVRWACPAGGLVYDPFTGSGSTGLACMAEGRRFVGSELDAGWTKVARERLGLHWDVPPLFAETAA